MMAFWLHRHLRPSRLAALCGMILAVTARFGAADPSLSSVASSPSPSADVDLICHTHNPADCYPRVFQPTDEFQAIHEDQELPSGLHVRLNVWTGQREAKINVPDEADAALEGLPVESSVVVVEPESGDLAGEVQIPEGAPAYDSVGKIKKPAEESGAFYSSLKFLKKNLNLDEALETLEDISHDIYYGLKVAEDYDTVKSLLCLASDAAAFSEGAGDDVLARARLAALVISGAVQNNAKALAQIERHWAGLKQLRCPGSSESLATATFRLVATGTPEKAALNDPALAKARASVLRGLIKSPVIRKDFLADGGMGSLLEALVLHPGPGWEAVQRRVAQLVQDNFLDESMGGTVGEWPTDDQATEGWCRKQASVSEACWDWEVKRIAQQHGPDEGHWSVELWSWLSEARRAVQSQPPPRVEL